MGVRRSAQVHGRAQAADARARERAERRAEVDRRAREVRSAAHDAVGLEHAPSKRTPGTFSHLYSSRDGALSIFEDAAGHVIAVDSARLA